MTTRLDAPVVLLSFIMKIMKMHLRRRKWLQAWRSTVERFVSISQLLSEHTRLLLESILENQQVEPVTGRVHRGRHLVVADATTAEDVLVPIHALTPDLHVAIDHLTDWNILSRMVKQDGSCHKEVTVREERTSFDTVIGKKTETH